MSRASSSSSSASSLSWLVTTALVLTIAVASPAAESDLERKFLVNTSRSASLASRFDARSPFTYRCNSVHSVVYLSSESWAVLRPPSYRPSWATTRSTCGFKVEVPPNEFVVIKCYNEFDFYRRGDIITIEEEGYNVKSYGRDNPLGSEDLSTNALTFVLKYSTRPSRRPLFLCIVSARSKTTISSASTESVENCRCGVSVSSRSNSSPTARIVGGTEATPHAYPWHVGVVNPGTSVPWCAGTLVTDRHVVTAAHCINEKNVDNLNVIVGVHDFSNTGIVGINVSRATVYPSYNKESVDFDVGVIELTKPVVFNSHVRPACLPKTEEISYVDKEGVVTGWGTTAYNGYLSATLQMIKIPIWDQAKCKGKVGLDFITDHMMCAGPDDGLKDSCQGDSGGPLIVKKGSNYVLAGVVSWGYECATAGMPGVYARVTAHLPWLNKQISGGTTCPRD